jgi:hypothetical protein
VSNDPDYEATQKERRAKRQATFRERAGEIGRETVERMKTARITQLLAERDDAVAKLAAAQAEVEAERLKAGILWQAASRYAGFPPVEGSRQRHEAWHALRAALEPTP